MEKVYKVQDQIDNQLLKDRKKKKKKIFLWGMVDDDTAKHVVDRLLYLDSLNNDEIKLYINSPGGYVTSGSPCTIPSNPLRVLCRLYARDWQPLWGVFCFPQGKGRRFIQPHARVMIHQPSGGARGPASDIEITASEIIKTKELSAQILAENCGQKWKNHEGFQS